MSQEERDKKEEPGHTGLRKSCPCCGSDQFVMKNYDPMWHEGDIHCASCDTFVRHFDAG